MSRMQRILAAYILWELSRARVIKKVVRHIHAPAKAFSVTDLSAASIADLGTKDHDLLDGVATSTAHLLYLLLSGGTMTGDIDVGTNRLRFGDGGLIKRQSAGYLVVNTQADTARANWMVALLAAQEILMRFGNERIRTHNTAASNFYLTSFDTDFRNCIELVGGRADIDRAGDIDAAAADTYDIGATTAFRNITLNQYLNFAATSRIYFTSVGDILYLQTPSTVIVSTTAGIPNYRDIEVRDTFVNQDLYTDSILPITFGANVNTIVTDSDAGSIWRFQSHDGAAFKDCADLGGGMLGIDRAGDITMLDDKFIDLGNDTAGPAAAVAHRGKLRFVEGGAGARDRVYSCMKSDAGAYNWIEIANGGP